MTNYIWAEVNGVALRYHYRPGTGKTYVLLHEMGGTLESWDAVLTHLPADAGVLRYDQRGFGLSEKPTGSMTIDQHVNDLLSLLDFLQITQPVVLSGVAVGAGIAIAFSARHPDRVSHLLALAPACGVVPERRESAQIMAQNIVDNGMRVEASGIFDMAYPEPLRVDLDRYAQYRSAWLSNDSRSLGGIYRMLATQDLDAELAHLPEFTLLVGGTYDALRPEAEIRRLASLCPHAQTVFVPTGHFMQMNSPRFVAALLQNYPDDPEQIALAVKAYIDVSENRWDSEGSAR